MNWKSLLKWFAAIYVVLALAVYIIVTVGPIFACAFGVVVAACQSGNIWWLFAAQWILPFLIALITSPFMVDYVNTKNELKELKASLKEEEDADR